MKHRATRVVVVLALVAVGMGMVQPWWVRRQERDVLAECKKNLTVLGMALEMYSDDHGGRFPLDLDHGPCYDRATPLRLAHAVVPRYLKGMPTCPAAGTDTYSQSSWGAFGPDAFTIVCGGHHHAKAGQGTNYPQYCSTWGLVSQ